MKSKNHKNICNKTLEVIEELKAYNLSLLCTDKNLGVALINETDFVNLEPIQIEKLNVLVIDLNEGVVLYRLKQGIRQLLKNCPKDLLSKIWKVRKDIDKSSHLVFFRGLLKVHKKDLCVRPVVREAGGPLHIFSRSLVPLLRKLQKDICDRFQISHVLDNSIQIIKDSETFRYPVLESQTLLLVSADVVSMYPSFNKNDVIKELKILLDFWEFDPLAKDWLLNAVKFILWNNYFTHEGHIFKSTEGVATGDPISLMLANLFALRKEATLIRKNRGIILKFYRYVDDISRK